MNLTLIYYGIGGHFPVRCDAVTITTERRDLNGLWLEDREPEREDESIAPIWLKMHECQR